MHILVPVKRVVDPDVKVRVKHDGSGVDTTSLKMSINPFDEVALEQAVRLKEQGLVSKVTAVACNDANSREVLRTALAMGADAAMLIEMAHAPDALTEARLLHALVEREGVGLVLCGKQAIDDDLGAVAPMLAALLDWPQAVSVSRLDVNDETIHAACDADRGTDWFDLPLPAVLSVDLRLCEPRKITLPAIARAKKATIAAMPADSLAAVGAPAIDVVAVTEPPARPPGMRLDNVQALVERILALPALQA